MTHRTHRKVHAPHLRLPALRRLAPLAASVTALAALAAVPSGATAASAGDSASATTATSSTSSSTTSSTTGSTSSTATKPKTVSVKYQCVLLGQAVPVDLTWTLPANVVRAASASVPAGWTLKRISGGSVVTFVRIHLEKSTIDRLKYVDQTRVGGALTSALVFGSTSTAASYPTVARALKPASNGTQDLTLYHDISSIRAVGKGATTASVPFMAATTASTTVMIPGFTASKCTSAAGANRTMLVFKVKPATIAHRQSDATVRAIVKDGSGADAQGTIVESIHGAGSHGWHTVTTKLTLSKGRVDKSWGATMKSLGMTTGKVTITYAGRSASLTITR